MFLPRTTVCTLFSIGSPRWNGIAKRREVGLAENRISAHNEIEFTYIRKTDGLKSIPDHYYFAGKKLKQIDFERQNTRGTMLVIIPFDQLDILERGTPPPEEITDSNKMPPLIKKVFFDPPELPTQEKLL